MLSKKDHTKLVRFGMVFSADMAGDSHAFPQMARLAAEGETSRKPRDGQQNRPYQIGQVWYGLFCGYGRDFPRVSTDGASGCRR